MGKKKLDNVIYGGLIIGSAGITVATTGMAIDSFKKKDKFGSVVYTLASIASAGIGAATTKELININKKKK